LSSRNAHDGIFPQALQNRRLDHDHLLPDVSAAVCVRGHAVIGAIMALTGVLPNIVTERLIVRMANRKDRDTVLEFYARNREHLAPFSPTFPVDFFTPQYWDRQIDRNIDEFYSDQSARMFIFEQAKPARAIGNVSLGNIVRNAAQFCFLGYGLAEDKQGQGFATEAVTAAVQYAFTELKLHRVMANYIPTNEKSGNVLKRAGFVVEGYARDYLFLNGKWQDHIMTAVVNPKW
jgi:ribosomal-protein-alanine N-acetyltransferase